MKTFAVFGNPIKHSYSPLIHQLFAKQHGISLIYNKKFSEIDHFEDDIKQFFHTEGIGANITTPFKERAYKLCQQLTERAKLVGAVNTIKKLEDGQFLGDNTDGIGLLTDLQRLNMLKPHYRILIIGAGGASKGIIYPLLMNNHQITITNRTMSRAQQLVERFISYGEINAVSPKDLISVRFDLIINATTCGLMGDVFPLPNSLFHDRVICYDLFYQQNITPFLLHAERLGVTQYADGIGMLISQAAHSYALWHKVMPDISTTLRQIQEIIKNNA